jgi:SAM-dependent methyltransferase
MTLWAQANVYESYIGRWSRLVAPEFVDWLAIPPGRRWLDVGAGTGALSATILERAAPASVHGVEPSAPFVAHARNAVPAAAFTLGDAEELPFEDARFDVVVSGLVLNFVPGPAAGLAEMVRVLRPGGTVAAYVWDYAGAMEMIRIFWDSAAALDPAAQVAAEGQRFPLCEPSALESLFSGAGLGGIAATAIDVPTRFRDFDDYWLPFLGGNGPAPAYAAALPDEHQARLRERLRSVLPAAPDGSISLVARAWAIRGAT